MGGSASRQNYRPPYDEPAMASSYGRPGAFALEMTSPGEPILMVYDDVIAEDHHHQNHRDALREEYGRDTPEEMLNKMQDDMTTTAFVSLASVRSAGRAELARLPPIRLNEYVGLWRSFISTTPCFQPVCMGNVTAHYMLDSQAGELLLENKGTCLGAFLCRARGAAVPVGDANIEDGPRDYNAHFCVDRDWNDRRFSPLCPCAVGSYQILAVGYNSDSPRAMTMNYHADSNLQQQQQQRQYDWAIVGNADRTHAWLLVRDIEQPGPYGDRLSLGQFLARRGYSSSIYEDLETTRQSDLDAHTGKDYISCFCPAFLCCSCCCNA